MTSSRWLPFEEAREFARRLNLKDKREWERYRSGGARPKGVPSDPHKIYRRSNQWISWRDWLGTEKLLPFDKARTVARGLEIYSRKKWSLYCTSGNKPSNIPSDPHRIYKKMGEWVSWEDWLGKKSWLPFEEARNFARGLGLKSRMEWEKYRSIHRPNNIPSDPHKFYGRTNEWVSWNDWLGIPQWTFETAREFVSKLGMTTIEEWRNYAKSGAIPKNMPKNPVKTYRHSGWTNWKDWLGIVEPNVGEFLPFIQARRFVRNLKLKTTAEWWVYSRSGDRPDNIPHSPHFVYRTHGWISFVDWLGNGRRPVNSKFISYNEFVERIRQEKLRGRPLGKQVEFFAWVRSDDYPSDMPSSPADYYSRNK